MILIIWVIPNEANFKKEIYFVTYDEYYGGLKNYLLVRHTSLSIYGKMTWYMWFSLKYLNLNKIDIDTMKIVGVRWLTACVLNTIFFFYLKV